MVARRLRLPGCTRGEAAPGADDGVHQRPKEGRAKECKNGTVRCLLRLRAALAVLPVPPLLHVYDGLSPKETTHRSDWAADAYLASWQLAWRGSLLTRSSLIAEEAGRE